MNNAIYTIQPYKFNGMWVFDDDRVGLIKEAFVAGMDDIMDKITESFENASQGFNLVFSEHPFPEFDISLSKIENPTESAYGGTWYYCNEYDMNGWLCPALFLYYPTAPANLYAKAIEVVV
jgi:hypothetical protein